MSNEELVLEFQQGNKKALDELINENEGLVKKIANKFYTGLTNSIEFDDLIQEGNIGLIEAAKKYDFNNENKAIFSTYAVYRIYGRISRFIKSKNTNGEISLDTPFKGDDSIELKDTIPDRNNLFIEIENNIYIQELRQELECAMNDNNTLYERDILKLIYGWDSNKECTYREVAGIFNISFSKVSADTGKALRKLKNSSWGKEYQKEYYSSKINEIRQGSRYDQDKFVIANDLLEKYFKGVV